MNQKKDLSTATVIKQRYDFPPPCDTIRQAAICVSLEMLINNIYVNQDKELSENQILAMFVNSKVIYNSMFVRDDPEHWDKIIKYMLAIWLCHKNHYVYNAMRDIYEKEFETKF